MYQQLWKTQVNTHTLWVVRSSFQDFLAMTPSKAVKALLVDSFVFGFLRQISKPKWNKYVVVVRIEGALEGNRVWSYLCARGKSLPLNSAKFGTPRTTNMPNPSKPNAASIEAERSACENEKKFLARWSDLALVNSKIRVTPLCQTLKICAKKNERFGDSNLGAQLIWNL